jgi:hypothetical protein
MTSRTLPLLALVLVANASFAAEDTERNAYFQALTTISPDVAAYSFVIEQYLDAKCHRPQSMEHMKLVLKRDDANALPVILALKAGDTNKAKAIIERLPCEQ